jgi:outer membrane protein
MMKRIIVGLGAALLFALGAGQALADSSIAGKVGVTGRIGFVVPADSDFGSPALTVETDPGFNFGGGLIYGIDRNFAVELDITRTEFGSNLTNDNNFGDFEIINIALGGQYRFQISQSNVTPYVGAGLNILISSLERNGNDYDIDTTLGVYGAGGVDYFLTKQVALNAEARVVIAPEADIEGGGGGNFDPSHFSGMFGVRFFFH